MRTGGRYQGRVRCLSGLQVGAGSVDWGLYVARSHLPTVLGEITLTKVKQLKL